MIDILRAIENASKADIVGVYTNLLRGSREHLRAFVKSIGVDGYCTEGDIMIVIPILDQAIFGFRYFYQCAVDPNPDFQCPPSSP